MRRTLDDDGGISYCWQRAVRGMVPLYYHPEFGAAIVAYLSPGLAISINDKESLPPRWTAIALELGGFAYLDKNTYSLKPALFEDPSTDNSS